MILRVFATYSTVYGKVVNYDDFKDIISNFNRDFLIGILLKVDCVFQKYSYYDEDCQKFFIKSFFPPSKHEFIFSKLGRIGNNKFTVVFTRQQLHNLIKLSIVHSNNNVSPNFDYVSEHIGDLFLMMNDFYDSLVKNANDINETNEYLVRNYLYNSEEAYRKKICRFHKLFVTLPILTKTGDFNDLFKTITGLDIEKFMAIGFSFLSHWNQIDFDNLPTFNPFIDSSTYFQNTSLTDREIESALAVFCDDIETCYSKIKNQLNNSKNWQLEFDIQSNKPLFNIPKVGIATHGFSFLQNKITDNIYWNILDKLPKDRGDEFLRDFGKVFERYIVDILKRTFKEKATTIQYDGDKEVGDCVVEIKRHIFIFEVKSGRLKKEIYTTGEIDKLLKDYREKLILRQLNQLSGVIKDFKNGRFKVGKISWDDTVRIFPICITLKEIPQLPTIREELEKIVAKDNLFEDSKIQQFQMMDVEEVEILEVLLGEYFKRSKFLDIILRKCGNLSLRSMSFKNYLYENTKFALFDKESDEIRSSFFELADKFSDIIFHDHPKY